MPVIWKFALFSASVLLHKYIWYIQGTILPRSHGMRMGFKIKENKSFLLKIFTYPAMLKLCCKRQQTSYRNDFFSLRLLILEATDLHATEVLEKTNILLKMFMHPICVGSRVGQEWPQVTFPSIFFLIVSVWNDINPQAKSVWTSSYTFQHYVMHKHIWTIHDVFLYPVC